jgi:hypothetical protein
MSASAKPPRKGGPEPASVDQVARVLCDAEIFGDAYAARRHKLHPNTVRNWKRARSGERPVVEEVARLKLRINEGWIETARAARLRLIERQLELAEKADAKLAAVTNALRRTNEVVLAHEVLNDGTDDAERHGADQPEDPGEDQGPDGAEGGRKTPED